MTSPTVSYDPDANALYLQGSRNTIAETLELSETEYLDVDVNGEPIGIAMLHAAPSRLTDIPLPPDTTALRDLLTNPAY